MTYDDDHDPVTDVPDLGLGVEEEIGGPPPTRRQVLVGVLVLAVFALIVALAVVSGTARDERAAAAGPGQWVSLGGPRTAAGGSTVYTRCDGYTRLYLTVGADGFPVGPVVQVPYEQGSRCDP